LPDKHGRTPDESLIGGQYKHHGTGNTYNLIGYVFDNDDDIWKALYINADGKTKVMNARSLRGFFEDSKNGKQRFELIPATIEPAVAAVKPPLDGSQPAPRTPSKGSAPRNETRSDVGTVQQGGVSMAAGSSFSGHPGAMVALMLTPEQTALLTRDIPGRLVQEADHCTLVYLAQDAASLVEQKPAIVAALAALAACTPPIVAPLNGYGRFTGDGTEYPLVVLLDGPALDALHRALCECLCSCGVELEQRHGFTPHVTLSYLPADKPVPNIALPLDAALTFAAISLVWGGERIDLPLLGQAPAADVVEAGEPTEVGEEGPELFVPAEAASLGMDAGTSGGALVADEFVHAAPVFKSLPPPDPANPYRIKKYLCAWGGKDLGGYRKAVRYAHSL
jgi:2'-5' RNA ligase